MENDKERERGKEREKKDLMRAKIMEKEEEKRDW